MKKTRKGLFAIACGLALAFGAVAAHAQDQDYLPHGGTIALSLDAAGVIFNSSAKFTLAEVVGGTPRLTERDTSLLR